MCVDWDEYSLHQTRANQHSTYPETAEQFNMTTDGHSVSCSLRDGTRRITTAQVALLRREMPDSTTSRKNKNNSTKTIRQRIEECSPVLVLCSARHSVVLSQVVYRQTAECWCSAVACLAVAIRFIPLIHPRTTNEPAPPANNIMNRIYKSTLRPLFLYSAGWHIQASTRDVPAKR